MLLQLIHKLYEIEDDVLGEEDLDLLEAEVVVDKHVPGDGGGCPEDHADPLGDDEFDRGHVEFCDVDRLVDDVINGVLDLDFPLVTKRHDFGDDSIMTIFFLDLILADE